ncbi:hypothetical protein [Methylococcus sp. EFPC2]|uniref:hypothetical protein n=1 Tax=Methylococcus sp. EFPC2 TaxID=2812648 RepID=UPI0019688E2C|nr:hypothetical protein [Methylococcus sp. EFPC2]QSA96186.1 hypothetical protein JWZ97_13225 [Methylococcus sp. EFPC2]
MNAITVPDESVLFGTSIEPETNRRLQLAVSTRHHNRFLAEQMLWEARAEDPGCLPVYFALYKFYANVKRLADAERAARLALAMAAWQGGFPADWTALGASASRFDPYASEAGRYYLHSLKALAFVRLRRGATAEAGEILLHLQRLDPEDRSGASVIRALAESCGANLERPSP